MNPSEKSKEGFIYSKNKTNHRAIRVYWTVAELRLCCGEIPSNEIERVIVNFE